MPTFVGSSKAGLASTRIPPAHATARCLGGHHVRRDVGRHRELDGRGLCVSHSRDQGGNRRGIHNGRRPIVLGVPLGAGAAHVVELRPVRVDQAPQCPAEFGKIRGKARGLGEGARLRLLIGASHGGSHFASIARTVLARGRAGDRPVVLGLRPGKKTARLANALCVKASWRGGQSVRQRLIRQYRSISPYPPLLSLIRRHAR
jgi:hypothetical protein